ncbi:Phosphoglycerate dehydrogenase [Promicromonospora umidemergens]|uniref:Glyoxylate/hydroxypyruvate reductase A n=1 Tax=Promicromonospora umidemergens TaxID=629679 RepID=A0ABP8XP45_9MICO|nr:NAD(P)-dependent oxidoreductase [Promicromonospora umidemergens]MCP2281912.1 Phosphoglycerate dehydrogenase [Promicromonospora umidemergens]
MTSELTIHDLAGVLRTRPTVHLGDDVVPGWRGALATWALAHGLEIAERDATLAITARPDRTAGAAWVHSPYAGIEHLASALPDDVLLTRTTGTMPQRIAEYVLAWVLAERWQTARYLADSASGTWDPADPPAPPGRNGAVVIGTGTMGQAIARALAATGHRVTGLSRSGRPDDAFDDVLPFAQAHDAPAPGGSGTDVVVLALPHTAQTAGLITPQLLRAFDGVHLVNIGRGSAIRTDTLLHALDTGRVRHATLDVTEQEPLGPSSPLWRRPDVTITPHISGRTLPSDVVAALDEALTQIRAGVRPASAAARDRGY